jgi:hypothetical protein
VSRGIGLVLGCLRPLTRRLNEQDTKVVLQPLEAVIRTFSRGTLPRDPEAQPQVRLGGYAVSQVARPLPRSLGKVPGLRSKLPCLRSTLFGQRGSPPGCRCKLLGFRGRLPGLPSKLPGFRGLLFCLRGKLPRSLGKLPGFRGLLFGLRDLLLGCAESLGGLPVLVLCKLDFSGLLLRAHARISCV